MYKAKVILTKHEENIWSLPKVLMNQLDLKENEFVFLKCGTSTLPVQVRLIEPDKSNDLQMGLSSSAMKSLGIPKKTILKIKATGIKEFRLGPVIGILTFSPHIPDKLSIYRSYINSALVTKSNGLLYIFSGKDMNTETKTIKGYHYDHMTKEWKPSNFPFPDVVMNRIYPTQHRYLNALEKVIGPNKAFNKITLISKKDFLKTVLKDEFLRNYIPETRLLRNVSDLQYFLDKYDEIFLKPTDGMKGKGIILLIKTNNGWKYRFRKDNNDITEVMPSPDKLYDILKSASKNNKPYIIQQGIDCLKYSGGPFSIRTCPIKNGQNRWVMPGFVVIGSFGNSFITNYASGGKRIPLKNLYKTILPKLPYTKDELLSLLKTITLKAATVLDEKLGPLGELGVDIIIDKEGNLWLLEANGNPARTPAYIQTEFPSWPNHLYENLFGYAGYLAGFN